MKKAFSLIELAIALMIMGLVIGGSIELYSVLNKNRIIEEMKQKVQKDIEAIKAYAFLHLKLPNTDEFESAVPEPIDYGTKRIIYKVDNVLTQKAAVCNVKNTSITIRLCKDAECENYTDIKDIAFLILSRGKNKNLQTDYTKDIVKVYPEWVEVDDFSKDGVKNLSYDDIIMWVKLDELKKEVAQMC
ncbi:MAG: type II secretion system protein, partial [Epsilonproteobacteria bacterium]|nr:type II secretion system protein [Campylobacterota bacterium]